MPVLGRIAVEVRTLAELQQTIIDLYTKTPNNKTLRKKAKALIEAESKVRDAWESYSVAVLTENAQVSEDKMKDAFHFMLRGYIGLSKWRVIQIKVFVKKKTRWLKNEEVERAMPDYYDSINKADQKIMEIDQEREPAVKMQLLDQTNELCNAIIVNQLNQYQLNQLTRKNLTAMLFSFLKWTGATVGGGLILLLLQYIFQLPA